MGDPASSTVPQLRRRHSFSTNGIPDKVSLEIKDDVFVANLMATLNPEPWEIKKRLKSQIPVDHIRRKARDLMHADLNNESHQFEYARNNQADGMINSRASNGQGNQLDPSQSSCGDPQMQSLSARNPEINPIFNAGAHLNASQ